MCGEGGGRVVVVVLVLTVCLTYVSVHILPRDAPDCGGHVPCAGHPKLPLSCPEDTTLGS